MYSDLLKQTIREVSEKLGADSKAARLFANCYPNTLETTTKALEDGRYFVFTGDIPAMWLRDSSAQVRHYLPLAKEHPEIAAMIEGLCRQHTFCMLQDPYANAFNETSNGHCYRHDQTDMIPLDWERKYEIDSLCYPIQLAYLLWKTTGREGHLDAAFHQMLRTVTDLWILEQHHENSPYRFVRTDCPPSDTLPLEGKGNPVVYTGMTWSGFRPSDDACLYGYLIPSNMFAVVVLKMGAQIAQDLFADKALAFDMLRLREEIDQGIKEYGIIDHPRYGKMYAYEVDGHGGVNLMDDANVPSLLSIPYLGYTSWDDPVYQNTRRFILSEDNPYYYKGTALSGIGSPHTPKHYVWPIALCVEGLTTHDPAEAERIMKLLTSSDAGTGYMHEGVFKDDPSRFTRSWFAWANSIFSEFVLHYLKLKEKTCNL